MSDDQNIITRPKVFISYSQTSVSYKAVILGIAEDLATDGGIDVVLDQWDLQEGQDVTAFMESMVIDPSITKVLVFSDKEYAEKANKRVGGVGTETQIISKEIYEQVGQTKFIPIVMEFAGKEAFLPVFMKSRLYLDMSSPVMQQKNFKRLVRAIHNRPREIKPIIGATPSWVYEDDSTEERNISNKINVITERSKDNRYDIGDDLDEILNDISKYAEQIHKMSITNDDEFYKLMRDDVGIRDYLVAVVDLLARRNLWNTHRKAIHGFLETQFALCNARASEYNKEAIRVFYHEAIVYSVAVLLKREKYLEIHQLLNARMAYRNEYNERVGFFVDNFYDYSKTLERRLKQDEPRLFLPSWASVENRKTSGVIDFGLVVEADLIIYVNSILYERWWYPVSIVYTPYRQSIGLFHDIISEEGKIIINNLFGISTIDEFVSTWERNRSTFERTKSQLNFHLSIDLEELINYKTMRKISESGV